MINKILAAVEVDRDDLTDAEPLWIGVITLAAGLFAMACIVVAVGLAV